jgi:hypothetical protein
MTGCLEVESGILLIENLLLVITLIMIVTTE